MKPRMSSAAQSTLPWQPMMSFGPMLTTITDGSKPNDRWLSNHSDMLAPGLLAMSEPAWKPTPAAILTGPQPRSASSCASDGPQPGTRGGSYAEPSMTESPTTAIPPRGPGASRTTVTNNNSAEAVGGATTTAQLSTATTSRMTLVRIAGTVVCRR